MATKPAEEAPGQLTYKTWALKVSIHCEGCKKKVKKVLQAIEGVYKVDIDAQQQKVTVTGNVEAETLLKKLLRSGKQSELWPENPSSKSKKKKKKNKSNKDNPSGQEAGVNNNDNDNDEDDEKAPPHATEEGSDHEGEELPEGEEEEEEAPTGDTPGAPVGGKKKKNKKKKNKGQNGNVDLAPNELPSQQVYPYGPQMSYPSQPMAYGLSYNTAYPSASESFYTTSIYGHHGSNYRYHPPSDRIYPEGDHDHFDYNDEADVPLCEIM